MKKTKAAEKEALKKRKFSEPAAQPAKKLKMDASVSNEAIYVDPLASAPPTAEVSDRRLISFSEEHEAEENPTASSKPVDEEIDIDANATSTMVSLPQP